MSRVRIQTEDFDLSSELARQRRETSNVKAIEKAFWGLNAHHLSVSA